VDKISLGRGLEKLQTTRKCVVVETLTYRLLINVLRMQLRTAGEGGELVFFDPLNPLGDGGATEIEKKTTFPTLNFI